MQLVIPKPGSPITAGDLIQVERRVAQELLGINDLDILMEWHDKARALEAYLRAKELQKPMVGVQRRLEARIGQLLTPHQGKKLNHHDDEVLTHSQTRHDFRILAHALNGRFRLHPDQWRQSRRALVSYMRIELGLVTEKPEEPDAESDEDDSDSPQVIWRRGVSNRAQESIELAMFEDWSAFVVNLELVEVAKQASEAWKKLATYLEKLYADQKQKKHNH